MLADISSPSNGLPGLELGAIMQFLLIFFFSMLRVGAFVVSAPLFSATFIPLLVRIVMAVCLTVPLIGAIPLPHPDAIGSAPGVAWVIRELAIGLAAGLLLQILFAVAVVAGDRIANTAGLGLAAQVDPNTGSQSPVIGQFFTLFLITIFLSLDGHLVAIRLVLESYVHVPIAAPITADALVEAGVDAAGAMFLGAAQIMMPVVAILLILNFIIGVITRSAPQLNIFAFGFPLTMSATLILLFLTTTGLGYAFAGLTDEALARLASMIREVGGG